MSNLFDGFSATTTFPDHDPCFGNDRTNITCLIPSPAMINFLNITRPDSYLDSYCNKPPVDSCAFGYCPNPDVASPAVRFSAYFTSLVSAILVLYSPEDVESSFFAQLLNVYSLIVAAMIAIARRNLTKYHSVVALTLAASPLSLYLLAYLARSLFHKHTRLDRVFGEGKHLNRIIVIVMFPLWIGVLSFIAMPTSTWEFQQAACDSMLANNPIISAFGGNWIVSLFFLPFIFLFMVFPGTGAALVAVFLLSWGTAIYRQRKIIWAKHNKRLPFGRLWRKVSNHYPFIQFCTVIVLPHLIWIFNIEIGLHIVSMRESFSATYGQLLAIFVTIPSFIQLCVLLPRVPRWFWDLTWVRLLTCRRNAPRRTDRPDDFSGLVQDGIMMQKYDPGALHSAETSEYTITSTLKSAPGY